jgi:plastocyanin
VRNALVVFLVFSLPLSALLHEELQTGGSYSGAVFDVEITGSGFVPQSLDIREGDTVRWINKEPVSHTLLFTFVGNGSTYLLSDMIPAHSSYDSSTFWSWTHTFGDAVKLRYISKYISGITGLLTVGSLHERVITFTESGLPLGTRWWVDLNGENRSSTSSAISFSESDGTYAYRVGQITGFEYSPHSGTITVTGEDVTQHVTFTAVVQFISVVSEFSGYFLRNMYLMNTFSVYTGLSGAIPSEVYGILDGTRYVFSNPANPSGSYDLRVDMGSLHPDSSLEVSAVYSDGTVLHASYPIKILETPSWLMSIIRTAASIEVDRGSGKFGEDIYTIDIVAKEFDFPDKFNMNIPLPSFAGGGTFTLIPAVSVEFSFSSDGVLSISCPLKFETPKMNFGPASVTVELTLSASGEFALQRNSIEWLSATLSLEVATSSSVNVPIAGYTFDVPYFGEVTIGLAAKVTVNADFAVNMILAPTQNTSEELTSGLEILIQSITGQISFSLGLALKAGIGIAEISGGGSVGFTVYLKPEEPYVSGGVVTGNVVVKWKALIWTGEIWSMSGRLYEWGYDPYTNTGSVSNSTIIPRYYDTQDYEGFVWTDGVWNGTALQDIYPFTRISASSYGENAYILYTSDNVSLPEEYGLCLAGLEFNSGQRTLKRLPMPPIVDEIFFDPVAITLPNGTLAAMWDSIPYSIMSNATSPFDIDEIVLRYSYFDADTGNWGSVRNLTENGIANSYSLYSDSTGCYALVLEGDSMFPSSQYLVEYDIQSGSELLNMSIANASNIVSFNKLPHLAVVQLIDGSYELLNLSTDQLVAIPSMSGYSIKDVQLAMNSTDSLGILYSNPTSDSFSIYNVSSSTVSFSMNVTHSTSQLTLIQVDSGYYLITADSSGVAVHLVDNRGETSILYPMEKITSMGATTTDDGILVYTTENQGNASYPLLDLTLTFIPRLPSLLILSPENKAYNTSIIPMNFTMDRPVSWAGYSLDGQPNATIDGNILVDIPDGLHSMIVYASDTLGNMGASNTVYFVIDTAPPNITNVTQNPSVNDVKPSDTVRINVTVTDALSRVRQVILNYTNGNGTWTAEVMTNVEGNVWNANIPAFPDNTYVNYTIAAEDNASNSITTEKVLGYQYQYHVSSAWVPNWHIVAAGSLGALLAAGIVVLYFLGKRKKQRKS